MTLSQRTKCIPPLALAPDMRSSSHPQGTSQSLPIRSYKVAANQSTLSTSLSLSTHPMSPEMRVRHAIQHLTTVAIPCFLGDRVNPIGSISVAARYAEFPHILGPLQQRNAPILSTNSMLPVAAPAAASPPARPLPAVDKGPGGTAFSPSPHNMRFSYI